jgi:oxygen-independent coproporphyrinogen-3 oxidase
MRNIGMYVHIPFCAKKCDYCSFVSYSSKNEYVKNYVEALKREIIDEAKEYASKCNIKTIYIGGGTPSFINDEYIKEVMEVINENWKVEKKAEITIEVNPGTVNLSKLKTYYSSGINRLSIGLQSSNNNILKNIGRIYLYEEFLETYNLARKIGFKNINVDVIIGLPYQTINEVKDTINKIIELNTEHISVYSLMLEEGTKMYNDVELGIMCPQNEKEERESYWWVKRELEKVGFIHYEISNFAKERKKV